MSIRVEMIEQPFEREPVFWCASCSCGWSMDTGTLTEAEELAREHEATAECDW